MKRRTSCLLVLLALAGCGQRDDPAAWDQRLQTVVAAVERGALPEAESLLREALVAQERAVGAGHPGLDQGRAMLADLVRQQGRDGEAETLYRQTLAAWQERGESGPASAAARLGLAQVLSARGDNAGALAALDQAVADLDRSAQTGPAQLAAVLSAQSALRSRSGDLAGAESAARRLLTVAEAAGPGTPLLADALEALAGICAAAGKGDEAKVLVQRAIVLHQGAVGDGTRLGLALFQYAELCRRSGPSAGAEAETAYRKALAQWEQARGANHPDIAAILNGLAATLAAAGRTDEADAAFVRALGLLEAKVGVDSPDLIPVLANRVRMLAAARRWPEAKAGGARILAIVEKTGGGGDSRDLAGALDGQIALCVAADDLAGALVLNQRLVAMLERVLGPQDANLAVALRNGADLLRRSGREAEAAQLQRRAEAIAKP